MHLTSLGHERIAYVGNATRYVILDREEAYREHLGTLHLTAHDGYIRHAPNTIGGGASALAALMELPSPPTAIIAATDILAIGVINAAFARDIKVPADLSVVGFDDIALAAGMIPSLTTVRMPIVPMIAAGVKLAVGESDWNWATSQDPPRVVFDPKLIVRGSTGAARSAL
jgi:LacI family transcriptional regulator